MSFGALVQSARSGRGWSQADLAGRVGVSRVQISRIESGRRGTDVQTLDRLVRALELDPGEAMRLAAAELAGAEAAA